MKFIRWQGLIAFVVIVGGIGAFWLLLADTLLKSGIEKYGSEAAGAKVSVKDVDISIHPLGLKLVDLQVANSEAPMTNAMQFDRAVMHLNFLKLLMGQVIIDEMAIDGLRFGGQRTTSGALPKKTKPSGAGSEGAAEEPSMLEEVQQELPSADEVMAREPLLTTQRKQELAEIYDAETAKVDAAMAKIPDNDKLKSYEDRIKVATSGKVASLDDFKRRQKELDQVKDEIRADQKAIRDAKEQTQTSRDAINDAVKALKAAPGEDLANLKAKYKLDEGGAANMAQLLFGDETGAMAKKALYYYELAKPYLASSPDEAEAPKPERAKGRFVRFPTSDPTPDFLLRKAHLGITIAFGELDGTLKDVTNEMDITGRPATLTVRGKSLQGMKDMAIDGVFDHIKPDNAVDKVTFSATDIQVQDYVLVKGDKLPVTLKQAVANINGDMVLKDGVLKANAIGLFDQARFDSRGEGGFGKAVSEAINGISEFDVKAKAKMERKDIDFEIFSNLDKQISRAISEQLNERKKAFEASVKGKLDAEKDKATAKVDAELAKLDAEKQKLENQLKETERMLQAKVDDFKSQQKQEVDKKLKDLKNKLKL